jgi:uncharacterized protein YdaT
MSWSTDEDFYKRNAEGLKREKSLDIANALIEEGYEEGRAFSIAIAQIKERIGNSTPVQHIIPHPNGWAVKAEKASYVFDTKKEALKKGQQIASTQKTRLVIHRQDGTIEKHQNFAV